MKNIKKFNELFDNEELRSSNINVDTKSLVSDVRSKYDISFDILCDELTIKYPFIEINLEGGDPNIQTYTEPGHEDVKAFEWINNKYICNLYVKVLGGERYGLLLIYSKTDIEDETSKLSKDDTDINGVLKFFKDILVDELLFMGFGYLMNRVNKLKKYNIETSNN